MDNKEISDLDIFNFTNPDDIEEVKLATLMHYKNYIFTLRELEIERGLNNYLRNKLNKYLKKYNDLQEQLYRVEKDCEKRNEQNIINLIGRSKINL